MRLMRLFQTLFIILLVSFIVSFSTGRLWATHNLAGQITYSKIGPNTYRIILTTYTDPSQNVDDCSLNLEIWSVQSQGAGVPELKTLVATLNNIPRKNGGLMPCNSRFGSHPRAGNGVVIRSPIKKNEYDTVWRFNGPGIFELRFGNYARVQDVKNMSNSVNTSFYVETRLNNNPFIGDNNSPILLNDPIDDACTNKIWTHNPGGYDPDGDSLVYSLVNSQQYDPTIMNRPISTDGFSNPGNTLGNGPFTIDSQTGIITWNTAKAAGWYNIAILVEEYRNGRLIGYVIRDMAINVKICRNDPPEIEAPDAYCIRAGDTLKYKIRSWDPNLQDSLYFYLNNNEKRQVGGPFAVAQSPAQLLLNNSPLDLSRLPLATRMPRQIEIDFEWNTICDHVRKEVYQVDYYAHDNNLYNPATPRLAKYDATLIRVVAEAVRNVRATPASRKIVVEWDKHRCESGVIGYEVYRAVNPLGTFGEDTLCCSYRTGIPTQTGYRRVAYLVGADKVRFEDDNNGKGLEYKAQYCYRVQAIFKGNVRSCASEDTCVRIQQDMPVIINNTVDETNTASGQITVRWVAPDTSKIKTEFFPPPYTYEVYRTLGHLGTNFNLVTKEPKAFEDTEYIDENINTEGQVFRYRIKLLDNTRNEVAVSDPASSIFLTATPSANAVRLFWREAVPWVNQKYLIYRKLPDGNSFDLLDEITADVGLVGNPDSIISHTYLDKGLELDKEYCYYIHAIGTYFSQTQPELNDLDNLSNIRCVITKDTIPPCFGGQDSVKAFNDCENFNVRFDWIQPDTICAGDLEYVSLYYALTPNGNFSLLQRTQSPAELNIYIDNSSLQSNVGCYYLTATDRSGNESKRSEIFCLDNCPDFVMPNIFTPNGDGVNDILVPMAYRSISSFSFKIFDRWGVELSTSNDPLRLWDGKTKNGNDAPEGYYFYLLEYTANNASRSSMVKTGGVTLLR